MKYLSVENVVEINKKTILEYSPAERIGILNEGLLESAVHRPQQSLFGEDAYKTVYDKAAVLFESLALNHCFENGNKRTAFWALLVFLRVNGYELLVDDEEGIKFTLGVVVDKMSWEESSKFIEDNSILIKDNGS